MQPFLRAGHLAGHMFDVVLPGMGKECKAKLKDTTFRVQSHAKPHFCALQVLVDLYCGVGLFAISAAKHFQRIFGVEALRVKAVEAVVTGWRTRWSDMAS